MKALYVDNCRKVINSYTRETLNGFEWDTAKSFNEFLEKLDGNIFKYDVISLDYNLEDGYTGLDCINYINHLIETSEVKPYIDIYCHSTDKQYHDIVMNKWLKEG